MSTDPNPPPEQIAQRVIEMDAVATKGPWIAEELDGYITGHQERGQPRSPSNSPTDSRESHG
jgi:hypothetical protein